MYRSMLTTLMLTPPSHPMTGYSLVAQKVKNPPAMKETQVPSLGQEDPLEKEWLPTPVFLPGKPHGQRSPVGYSPWGHKESDKNSSSFVVATIQI